MRWEKHLELQGRHAQLMAPSSYSWLNYDDDKIARVYTTSRNARLGDRKHALAAELIALRVGLPEIQKTMNMYVNDAIGFKMQPEQPLYFSENCFGTADAISFRQDTKTGIWVLRIHDLKTGTTRTSMLQLMIYAVIFCVEYDVDMATIEIELRIYKGDDIEIFRPGIDDLLPILSQMRAMDAILKAMAKEEFGD